MPKHSTAPTTLHGDLSVTSSIPLLDTHTENTAFSNCTRLESNTNRPSAPGTVQYCTKNNKPYWAKIYLMWRQYKGRDQHSTIFFPHTIHLLFYNLRFQRRKWKLLVAQLCPTFCNPMDCRPPGSSVHGILQARMLEWVAIRFSRGCSWLRDRIWVSGMAGRFFTVWAIREAPWFQRL